jgi:outer membrane receptor protein involved in Fe transport
LVHESSAVLAKRCPVLVAVLLNAATAAADEPADTSVTAPGETIVITGLRLPRPVKDVPPAVTVLDRDAIERSPAKLTDDLLRALPSVGTFRRSSSAIADPTSQGLNLRGTGPSAVSRALVLRDGIPANDPFGGWVYWRAFSPLDLERVEVAPSGGSALFGDFALGGVVQLISRPIEDRSAEVLVAGGSLETGRVAARATDRMGAFGIGLDGELFHSAGYAPIAPEQRGAIDGPAGSDHGTLGARIEHTHGTIRSHATARWFREALDAGTQLTTADVETLTVGVGTEIERDAGTLAVDLFGGGQEFRQQRARVSPDRSTAALASEQHTPSRNVGALATWTMHAGDQHELVLGTDARRVTGTANDVLSPAMVMPASLVERSAGGEQRFAGVFVEDAWHATSKLDVAGALRLDGWQNRAGKLALTRENGDRDTMALDETSALQVDPRIGVLARLTDAVSLRASGYRSFRAPTLNELYRPFQVGTVLTDANASLDPEVLWGAEAGPQIVVDQIVVKATGFYNHLTDAIGNVTLAMPASDGATRMRENFGTARITGVELEASWRPVAAWTVTVAETYMHATVTDAPDSPMLVGKRLAQDPRQRATASLVYAGPVEATARVRYLGNQFEDDLNTLPIGSVVLLDARIAHTFGKRITVFAAGENLADRRYIVGRAGVDTLGAPRTVEIGAVLATR